MRYFKNLVDSYVLAVGTGNGHTEITKEEYAQIVDVIKSRPTPSDGKDYRLTESLVWEEYDKPAKEVPELANEVDYIAAVRERGVNV